MQPKMRAFFAPVMAVKSSGLPNNVLQPNQAKAAASIACGSSPSACEDKTSSPCKAAASPCMICPLRTPPPHTTRRCVAGAWRCRCKAAACTVNCVSVACTSAGLRGAGWVRVKVCYCCSSQAGLKSSRPVLFGGGSCSQAQSSICCSRAGSTCPCAAHAPLAS